MGECSFWYRPTRVVPDQRPLNGRCCCVVVVFMSTDDGFGHYWERNSKFCVIVGPLTRTAGIGYDLVSQRWLLLI